MSNTKYKKGDLVSHTVWGLGNVAQIGGEFGAHDMSSVLLRPLTGSGYWCTPESLTLIQPAVCPTPPTDHVAALHAELREAQLVIREQGERLAAYECLQRSTQRVVWGQDHDVAELRAERDELKGELDSAMNAIRALRSERDEWKSRYHASTTTYHEHMGHRTAERDAALAKVKELETANQALEKELRAVQDDTYWASDRENLTLRATIARVEALRDSWANHFWRMSDAAHLTAALKDDR